MITGTMRVLGHRVGGVDGTSFNFTFDQDVTLLPDQRYRVTLEVLPDLNALRRVRLHHWRQVCKLSDSLCSGRGTEMSRINWRTQHAEHMGAVQALNDLFPIGDTAERDAATMR